MYTSKHPSGVTKTVKKGFSWTMLFFGIFVPLIRGDFKFFFLSLVAALFTWGISSFIFPFFYNKLYLNDLLEKGYEMIYEY